MTTSGRSPAVLGISVLALILGAAALAVSLTSQGPPGPQGVAGPPGSPGPAGAGLTPMTRQLFVEIFHQDSWARPAGIEAGLPEDERVATMYVWKPFTLYVFKGDTVELTVMNNAGHRVHSLVIPDFGVNTGPIPPRGDRAWGKADTRTVTFVADKVGTFKFECGMPFDPKADPQHCSPDHAYQYGYMVVLGR